MDADEQHAFLTNDLLKIGAGDDLLALFFWKNDNPGVLFPHKTY